MSTIICMKWGTRYGPEYVNRLLAGVRRHTKMPVRFVCFTDNAEGLHSQVEVKPLPAINIPSHVASFKPWPKLSVWQFPLFDLEGDILFLDIDLIITGPLDDFFTYHPNEYCVIENWTQMGQGIGNTSVFRFPAGKYADIYKKFMQSPETILKEYRVEQHYISAMIPEQKFWPAEWCVSFKHSILPKFPMNWFKVPKLPKDTRIVAFTGKPDPDEALEGRWPVKSWYKTIYKHVLPTQWIGDHWHEKDL
jgi:alpha-N-acetylglucosamine transferase